LGRSATGVYMCIYIYIYIPQIKYGSTRSFVLPLPLTLAYCVRDRNLREGSFCTELGFEIWFIDDILI